MFFNRSAVKWKTKDMTKMALCVAILCVTSFLVIPIPLSPVVISLHTIAVNIIGFILSPMQAGITVLIYLFMCLLMLLHPVL